MRMGSKCLQYCCHFFSLTFLELFPLKLLFGLFFYGLMFLSTSFLPISFMITALIVGSSLGIWVGDEAYVLDSVVLVWLLSGSTSVVVVSFIFSCFFLSRYLLCAKANLKKCFFPLDRPGEILFLPYSAANFFSYSNIFLFQISVQ